MQVLVIDHAVMSAASPAAGARVGTGVSGSVATSSNGRLTRHTVRIDPADNAAGVTGIQLESLGDSAPGREAWATALGRLEELGERFLLGITAELPPETLGSLREAARQAILGLVDAEQPDAILVVGGGILVELAVETGTPVVAHVTADDLAASGRTPRLREIVAGGLASCDAVVAADDQTAQELRDWIVLDEDRPVTVRPLTDNVETMIELCLLAHRRRHHGPDG
jgi:hypothetical protein